jgi:hypothetical protein
LKKSVNWSKIALSKNVDRCQTALLKIIEDWKKALDENKYIAAILMDLSKAFDCLPQLIMVDENEN